MQLPSVPLLCARGLCCMAASFWGGGSIPPPKELQVTHLTFGTLLLHPACASTIARPQQGLRAQLCHASDSVGFVGSVLLLESGSSVLGASP